MRRNAIIGFPLPDIAYHLPTTTWKPDSVATRANPQRNERRSRQNRHKRLGGQRRKVPVECIADPSLHDAGFKNGRGKLLAGRHDLTEKNSDTSSKERGLKPSGNAGRAVR